MEGGAWWPAVHGVAKSQTRLSNFTFTFHFHALEKEMAIHSAPEFKSSLMFSGFGFKPPASGFQFYFYSSL